MTEGDVDIMDEISAMYVQLRKKYSAALANGCVSWQFMNL
jgi:hypothetical protein